MNHTIGAYFMIKLQSCSICFTRILPLVVFKGMFLTNSF